MWFTQTNETRRYIQIKLLYIQFKNSYVISVYMSKCLPGKMRMWSFIAHDLAHFSIIFDARGLRPDMLRFSSAFIPGMTFTLEL